MRYNVSARKISISKPSFVSGEFGGNMGLFLGCSLLTLCEFLDFFWETFIFQMRKRSPQINADMKDTSDPQ